MISLRRMNKTEFEEFIVDSVQRYAREKAIAENWSDHQAHALSVEAHAKRLPQGLDSPNQYLYIIELDQRPVGRVWFGLDSQLENGPGYIYDVFVLDNFRRRGVATRALRILEKKAATLGVPRLALHVFGNNDPAIALYQKLGYQITNLIMGKNLSAI